jgi:light-regulated signal transduction histidine kinase (bacteriophytochrome)
VRVVRRIVGPLDQLTAAAARIGAGDLTQRLEVRTNDEIARLADAFNQMVTALAEQETQLHQRAEQLQQANSELEAFAYSVSHDLRAPLRAINGFARILLEEHAPHLSDEAQRYLHLVRDNAQYMGQLIDDLLTFSRLSRQPLKLQRVACAALVRQVLGELDGEQAGRCINISIGELPVCQADPGLLKQVFVNLLANALKFTRQREAAVVAIGYREEGGECVYFVRDNGVGFDMQYAGKLFGVFQRLHRAAEYEGTGVGLAIVQRIIHRHGGRIWAEAAVNQGATFSFTLGGDTVHD